MSLKWLLIILTFLICSCQKVHFTREFRDGVEIIKYINIDAWIPKYELHLQEEFTISGYWENDEFVTFGDPADFMVDEEDNIYFVDRRISRIHRFSKNGDYIKSAGREGKGPDESMAPGGIFQYQNHIFLHSQNLPDASDPYNR